MVGDEVTGADELGASAVGAGVGKLLALGGGHVRLHGSRSDVDGRPEDERAGLGIVLGGAGGAGGAGGGVGGDVAAGEAGGGCGVEGAAGRGADSGWGAPGRAPEVLRLADKTGLQCLVSVTVVRVGDDQFGAENGCFKCGRTQL